MDFRLFFILKLTNFVSIDINIIYVIDIMTHYYAVLGFFYYVFPIKLSVVVIFFYSVNNYANI